ncbi:MAG: exodeoxyribonuclease VII small subunit [Ruminococcus sp.]|nr:exodeoxyribonuclease VII small subunit [Ruminococcus sp.]
MTELKNSMDFEEAYAALREIVAEMENPKNKIEDNIALYEKACRLVLHCRKKLDEAKMQITDINERIAALKNSGGDIFED